MRVPRRSRRCAGGCRTSSPASGTSPAVAVELARQEPHHGLRRDRLAGARLAHHAEDFAGRDREGDILDGVLAVGAAGRRTERPLMARTGGSFAHAPHTRLAKRGSSVSRRPSPSMLMASTVKGEEDAGIEDVVRIDAEEGAALGHDVAPGRRLRRDADAEERQDSLDQDGGGANEGALHDQRRHGVGQDVAHQQSRRGRADRDRGLDVGLLPDRQNDGAHQADDARYLGHDDGDDHGNARPRDSETTPIASRMPGIAISPSMMRMTRPSSQRCSPPRGRSAGRCRR